MNDGSTRRSLILALLAGLMAGGQPGFSAEARVDPLNLSIGDPTRSARRVNVAVDRLLDTTTDSQLDRAELVRRLATTRILFIGEEHTNLEFHRVQLEVIRALHESGRRVIIGLEMFPWQPSAALARWSRGELDEESFLTESRWYETWSHAWGYYRDIFLYAQAQRLPLVGLNAPREVVREVRRARRFDVLDPVVRAQLPATLDPGDAQHRQLVESYFDPEDRLHAAMPAAEREGIYLAQLTWDAAMGWQAGKALSSPEDAREIVVVLAGSGHVAYDLGAARHVPEVLRGRTASLIPVVVDGGATSVSAAYARFLWGIPKTPQPGLPTLGLSLMGAIGKQPTQVIQIDATASAARAGIRVGDVLRGVDGVAIESSAQLQRKLGDYRWGETLTLEFEREGIARAVAVTLRRQ